MTRKTHRIEPTLSSEPHQLDEQVFQQAPPSHHSARHSAHHVDKKAEIINVLTTQFVKFFNHAKAFCLTKVFINKRINIIVGAIIGLLVIISLLMATLTSENNSEIDNVETNEEKTSKTINKANLSARNHHVTLPDNFSIMATNYHGIVIGWQAETNSQLKLWDIQTAQGDKSCQEITFNNGDSYRTNSVLVENGQQYFAYFSPLDNALIIKAIALRGNFSLCGYKFSLTGSQAVLGKHPYYSDLLSN